MWDLQYIKDNKITVDKIINQAKTVSKIEFTYNLSSSPNISVTHDGKTTFHFWWNHQPLVAKISHNCIEFMSSMIGLEEYSTAKLCLVKKSDPNNYHSNDSSGKQSSGKQSSGKQSSGKQQIRVLHDLLSAFSFKKVYLYDMSYLIIDKFIISQENSWITWIL